MNVDDIYGTLYSPLVGLYFFAVHLKRKLQSPYQDGTIDPHGLCTALSRYATRSGAKVVKRIGLMEWERKPETISDIDDRSPRC